MAGIDWGALLEGMGKGYVTGTNLTIAQEELKLKKAEDKRKEDDANKKIFETMENIAREGTAERPAISGEPAIQSVKDIKTFDMFRLGEIPSLSEFGQTPSTTVGPTIESAPSAPGLPSTLSRLGTPPYKPGKAPFLPEIQARPAVPAVEARPATPLSVEQVQAVSRGEIVPGIEYKPAAAAREKTEQDTVGITATAETLSFWREYFGDAYVFEAGVETKVPYGMAKSAIIARAAQARPARPGAKGGISPEFTRLSKIISVQDKELTIVKKELFKPLSTTPIPYTDIALWQRSSDQTTREKGNRLFKIYNKMMDLTAKRNTTFERMEKLVPGITKTAVDDEFDALWK